MLRHFLDRGEHRIIGLHGEDALRFLIQQLLHGKHGDLRLILQSYAGTTRRMVPLVPVTRTRAPTGSSGPETFHTPSPSFALPAPCSMASMSTSSLPTYCWPRWLRFGCSKLSGWRLR